MNRPATIARALLFASLAGCASNCENAPDLERMIRQPRADSYEPSTLFPDGRTMRPRVPGTVARGEIVDDPALSEGRVGNSYVSRIPIEVSREVVERGANRFGVFCAPCHGQLGDGRSQVAENMQWRKPQSLLDPRIRAYPPGRVYAVIKHGFGFMRSYANELDVHDRWATVAYVGALQLSQEVALNSLPPELQAEATPWLR